MLRSLIHEQWDASMCEALERQLDLAGDRFEDLWLTEEERLTVARRRQEGIWEHGDGITREDWVRKPRKPRKPTAAEASLARDADAGTSGSDEGGGGGT
mmetsp:Transcript_113293/g.353164  ORF Transcript_113293/g.353164 Transcript_113293/m.353164 type:complete len:99 (+) Transcript_113293:463-759(+)